MTQKLESQISLALFVILLLATVDVASGFISPAQETGRVESKESIRHQSRKTGRRYTTYRVVYNTTYGFPEISPKTAPLLSEAGMKKTRHEASCTRKTYNQLRTQSNQLVDVKLVRGRLTSIVYFRRASLSKETLW